MSRRPPLLRALLLLMGGIAGAVMLLAVFFTQTPLGREMVLAEVLQRVEGGLDGTLEVEGIASSGLLRGFTLRGVRLVGEDGRPFLAADSIRGAPSASALLRGDLVFSRVTAWRPRVTVEKLDREADWNVLSIFRPRDRPAEEGAETETTPVADAEVEGPRSDTASQAPDSAGTGNAGRGRRILIRDLRIEEGTLNVLYPAVPPFPSEDRGLYVRDERGRRALRRLTFTQIDMDLGSADLASPRRPGQRFDIRSFAMRGQLWEDPFFIQDLVGALTIEGPGLTLAMESLELTASELRGDLEVDWSRPGGVRTRAGGVAEPLNLPDLHWLEPRLPRGTASGPFSLELNGDGVTLSFDGTRADSEFGQARATGALTFGTEIGFDDLDLELAGVDLDILTPWVPDTLPLDGWLMGDLTLSGSLDTLSVSSDVTFLPPDSSGQAEVRVTGLLHLGEALGSTGLSVTVAPMDWRALRGVAPEFALQGPGSLRVEATGLLDQGLRVSAQATYTPEGLAPSRVTADGIVRRDSVQVFLEMVGELRPLSLTALRRDVPDLPVTGELDGTVDIRGPLSDLGLFADLVTSAGPLAVDGRFDALNPTVGYTFDAQTPGLTLSALLPNLPEPTLLAGRILASGRGLQRDSLSGEATAFIREGSVGTVGVDTAVAVLRVDLGTLHVDALRAETDLGFVNAGGTFGLASGAAPGELQVQFESESLAGLQPFFFGELPIAKDTLDPFEEDLLELEGVNIDTLRTLEEVRVDGAVLGQAILRGGLGEFAGEGRMDFQDVYFRSDYVSQGRITFSGEGLPGADRRVAATVETDSLRFRGFSFQEGQADLDVGSGDGRLHLTLARVPGEDYRARGTFTLDSLGGGSVDLDELTLRFDTVRWNLGGPAGFAWSDQGVRIRDFRLIRPGPSGMRIEADGFFPLAGDADLDVQLQRVNVATLARLAQLERSVEGVVDVEVRLTGTAAAPRAAATVRGDDLRLDELRLARLNSELEYVDRRISGRVLASEERGAILEGEGSFPADLRWRSVEDRFPDAPVDFSIALDSFPAALALAPVQSMEEVTGTLTGDVRIGGTTDSLEPSGEVRLAGGSVVLPALGVRYEQIETNFEVLPDASVAVDGALRSRGTARVLGTLVLDNLSNPDLNLTIEARNFLAVERRDVQARVSGSVRVRDRYVQPRVEGNLNVEQGVLFVEEFARTAEVVDLSDRAFFEVTDTSLTTLQPVLRAEVNPFLENLRLDVGVNLARDSWLRGRDLNVEMQGRLQVFWDRMKRDLAMVGALQAVRGIYTVFGRQFQVQEGTVSFLGTPGVNPNLDIRALNRLRTAEGDRLDILAQVDGTLLAPRVSLSSDAQFPISESDLVAYLIFGRPSYALASGQSRLASGAAGSLLGAATGAGVTLGLGALSSQIGSVFTRDVGLDYLAISQSEYADPFGTMELSGTVATTQVEVGQYLTDQIFAVLTWRPLTGVGGSGTGLNPFASLRVEWRLSDQWTLESFIEERFARASVFQARDLGSQQPKVLGFFLFRQWGY